jgi:hypothetical protein
MREGRAAYLISVIMLPDALGGVVGDQVQGGSFATIVDRRGVVVWRNVAAGRFVGKSATADYPRRPGPQRPRGDGESIA